MAENFWPRTRIDLTRIVCNKTIKEYITKLSDKKIIQIDKKGINTKQIMLDKKMK